MTNNIATSFPPLAGAKLHTLILGSSPGRLSLASQQYYAHKRNAFWPILCALIDNEQPTFDVHQQLSYEQRCDKLTAAGFGAWDVLASCERRGSLDNNIVRDSEQPNTIAALIENHPEITIIGCNGRAAHQLFQRHIAHYWTKREAHPVIPSDINNCDKDTTGKQLPPSANTLPFKLVLLPSSSPAMASLSLNAKFKAWQALLA